MLKVKIKDLETVMDYLKSHAYSEAVDFSFEGLDQPGEAFTLSFTDKTQKVSKVSVFRAEINTTPEVKTISKIYKKETI